ncbi:neuropeptide FF receptor 1-like [Stylophora pistillata]|uniref:neuropeptide FF receptor 1-like n=1 Tax=Stylophora pistillata TaxID=50429 RepID=UPI000C0451DE|nr:neuropeptide FF receptor 1-like [Stylophora pistillata]
MWSMYEVFAIVYSIMAVLDIIGNTFVILVVLRNQSMKTPVNYLLVNLAVADILVGIFFGIQFIITPTLKHPEGSTGDLLCKLITGGVPGWVGAVTSVFSLVAIAIERYFAVMYPHSQRGKLTMTKIVIFVVVSWFLAFLWAGVGFFMTVYNGELQSCVHSWPKDIYANVYTVGWTVVAGVMPLGIMGCLYARVVYRLWFKDQENEATQRALLRHRRRVTKLVIAVTVVYTFCWVPELTIYFLGFTGVIKLQAIHFNIASALVFLNSTVNPVVYSLQSSVFRRHFWNLVCCRDGPRMNSVNPDLRG